MSTITPTAEGMLNDAAAAVLAGVRTCKLATVVSYDAARQSCAAQVIVREARIDETGARVSEPIAQLIDVPVFFPRGGGARITFPLAKGDVVLVVFADHSLDVWSSYGGSDVDPLQDHGHDISNGIAFAGVADFAHALSNAPTDRVSIGYDSGATIEIRPDGVRIGDDSCSAAGRALAIEDTIDSAVWGLLSDPGVLAGIAAAFSDGGTTLTSAIATYRGSHPTPYATKAKAT